MKGYSHRKDPVAWSIFIFLFFLHVRTCHTIPIYNHSVSHMIFIYIHAVEIQVTWIKEKYWKK